MHFQTKITLKDNLYHTHSQTDPRCQNVLLFENYFNIVISIIVNKKLKKMI
jgi:pectate lyase